MGWTVDIDNEEEDGGGGVDLEKRKVRAVDNWVLRGLIREVMHTLIVYQEDLSYFEDEDE